jgi:catechol 2,3-dioxygenase
MPSIHPDTHLGAVHLTVSQLDVSLSFYREVIGLGLIGRRGEVAVLGADGASPLLVLVGQPGARPRPGRATGLYHVAILMPTRADLARSLRRLVEMRYPLQGASDHQVSAALYLADPDGIGLELYADRARESWAMRDRKVAMVTEALDLRGLLGELRDGPGGDAPGTDAPGSTFALHPATRIGHVHLRVSDLAATERFYHDTLGFDVMQRDYPGALFMAAGGYHHHIGTNIWGSQGGAAPPPLVVGLRHFTIVVPGDDALRPAIERLRSAHTVLEQQPAGWLLRDPSGNGIVMTEKPAGPTAEIAQAEAVAG